MAAFLPESAVTINLLSFSGSYIVETAVIVLHYIYKFLYLLNIM